jgi:hypothetical protein
MVQSKIEKKTETKPEDGKSCINISKIYRVNYTEP